ncbi:hypothetical protein [Salibacterium lacus]|uniref:Uncharacterized protein n=1 Tax=Salibacterium lacus TaxID=1898109 RepID=A0ABW5SZG7_9BACI
MGLLIGIPVMIILDVVAIFTMFYAGIDVTPLLAMLTGIICGFIGGMIAIAVDA